MKILHDFVQQYGSTILYTIITAVASYLGLFAKQLYTRYVNDKTKQSVAKTVVEAIEQVYQHLKGEEKLDLALASASQMLAEKGISVSDLEMRMLIEAAVGEFNNVFNQNDGNYKPVGFTLAEED